MAIQQKAVSDPTLLAAALEGLLLQRQRIDDQIATVRSLLGKSAGGRTASAVAPVTAPKVKRALSAAARRRIAEAQKKRWAEYRKKSDK